MRLLMLSGPLAIVAALAGCGENAAPSDAEGTPPAPPATPQTSQAPGPQGAADGAAASGGEAPRVETSIIGRDGSEIGALSVEPVEAGVRLSLHAEGLSPGAHAVHIHAQGRCEAPDFASAGGHFDPAGARHGLPDTDEQMDDPDHHAGDMLNQDVDDQALLSAEMVNRSVTLAAGPNALLDGDGSALIIHEGPDDYETQPDGAAGARVACAPITAGPAAGGE